MHCGVQENHDTCESRPKPEVAVRSTFNNGSKVGIIEEDGEMPHTRKAAQGVSQLASRFRVRKASIVFQKGPTAGAAITKAVVKVTRKDSCKNSIVVNMDGGEAEKIQKTR